MKLKSLSMALKARWILVTSLALITYIAISYNACSNYEFAEMPSAVNNPEGDNAIDIDPIEGGIIVEGGKPYINVQDVVLTLVGDHMKEMYITDSAGCNSGGVWEPFQSRKKWKLKKTNSQNIIFAKFKTADGNETGCAQDDIIHDNIAPSVEFASTPNAATQQAQAEISLHATDNLSGVAEYICYLNKTAPFSSCQQKAVVTSNKQGPQVFQAQVRDRAGNLSPIITHGWTWDKTPPKFLGFTQKPHNPSSDISPKIGYQFLDEHSSIKEYLCRIDGQAYASCTSATFHQLKQLSEGPHIFWVKAIDQAENFSEAKLNWTIDSKGPKIWITSGPPPYTNKNRALFKYMASDNNQPISQFECRLSNQNRWQTCNNGQILYGSLSPAPYTFFVRAKDASGNYSVATHTWTVDQQKPTVQLLQTPPKYSSSATAIFRYQVNDASGIQSQDCYIDGQKNNIGQTICPQTVIYTGLTERAHSFAITVTDRAGNQTVFPAYEWTIDKTPPQLQISGPKKINDTVIPLTTNAQDPNSSGGLGSGISHFLCQRGAKTPFQCHASNGVIEVNGFTEGPQVVRVQAVDRAGNVSMPQQSHSFTVDISPPKIHFTRFPRDHRQGLTSIISYQVTDDYSSLSEVRCAVRKVNSTGSLHPCQALATLKHDNLPHGRWEFVIQAKDELGNTMELSRKWSIIRDAVVVRQQFDVTPGTNKVDIILNIDNSGSMIYELSQLQHRLRSLLDQIKGLDWQIAFISTDGNNASYGDGRFIPAVDANNYYLSPADQNFAFLFEKRLASFPRGSDFETGIYTSIRAIERRLQRPNQNFFRPDAALAIVLISDEDESSSGYKHEPEHLINTVKQAFSPQKRFAFHSIITIAKPQPDTACGVSGQGTPFYGYRYQTLSEMTGGIVGSVCAKDYGQQLADIGKDLQQLVDSIALQCMPVDQNFDGRIDRNDISISRGGLAVIPSSVSGQRVNFSQPLQAGTYQLEYKCYK